jgi:hypothetical protein
VTPPPRPRFEIARLDDIPHTETDDRYGFQLVGEWRQIRHHFMIREFSANAFVATEAGFTSISRSRTTTE